MKKPIPRLQDVFDTNNLSGGQQNFLKCLVALPKVKQLYGDKITDIDIAIADDAKAILNAIMSKSK